MSEPKPMTQKEARDILARLDLSQNGFSRMIARNPVTVRRWLEIEAERDIPREIAILLRILTPADLKKIQAGEI